MTKITAKEFEERIAGDEALKAQVEKITGIDMLPFTVEKAYKCSRWTHIPA